MGTEFTRALTNATTATIVRTPRAGRTVISHTEPMSESDLASIEIQRYYEERGRYPMTMLNVFESATVERNVRKGRESVPVDFTFDIVDVLQNDPAALLYLTNHTVKVELDNANLGFTIGGELKFPAQKAANVLRRQAESVGWKISTPYTKEEPNVFYLRIVRKYTEEELLERAAK